MSEDHDHETWMESFRFSVGIPIAIVLLLTVGLWHLGVGAVMWLGEQLSGGPRRSR